MEGLRARLPFGIAVVLLLLGLVLATGRIVTREADPRPNLLLVSIDTLRADHLGYDGYERDTSPNLDRLAARSFRYREALAPAPWTLPSHAALLTGRHPKALGFRDREARLPEDAVVLAEPLRSAGYRTAAIVDSIPSGFIGAERGFSRGFEDYVHLGSEQQRGFRHDMAVTADRAIRWLEGASPRRPFFLFLHTYSVHALAEQSPQPDPRLFPYYTPEPWVSTWLDPEWAAYSWNDPQLGHGVWWLRAFNDRVASGLRSKDDVPRARIDALQALYDAGIRYVDHHLGRVLETLSKEGLAERTVVVITADHGEAFLEHDLLLHKEIYRDLLRVPLLVHVPGATTGSDVWEPVSLMDVAPTLWSLAGVDFPVSARGGLPPLRERPSEGLFTYFRFHPESDYSEAYGLREGPWSLVHSRLGLGNAFRTDLYDTRIDPGELEPVADEERRAAMRSRVESFRAELGAVDAESIELDEATLRHLEALGYAR